MTFYLVGGAVRDIMMGVEPKDRDYVVVGSTAEEMLALGFKQVGADFPVFLSPDGEEYALARRERKTGSGYHGFETIFTPDVTLEEDLLRRDFTMNAMALDGNTLIDPYGGRDDIREMTINIVSETAFVEDPVRLLRAARFACRYGFDLSDKTKTACADIVKSGELEHLTAERVSLEMTKALSEKKPSRFFEVLEEVGALEILFPELHALIGQTQPIKYHAEGDSFVHTMMVLDQAAARKFDLLTRFCALTHDLGKGLTPKHMLPHHYGHEAAGVPVVEAMCDRLKLPAEFKRAGAKCARFHMHLHKLHTMKDSTVVKIFTEMGGRNNPSDFQTLADVSFCDHHGRFGEDGVKPGDHPNIGPFMVMMNALLDVKLSKLHTPEEIKTMSVGKIRNVIDAAQRNTVKTVRQNLKGE